MVAMVTETFNV